MRSFRRVLLIATAVILVMPLTGQDRTITIHVGTLLDGKGGVQKNTNVVVEGSKIVRMDSNATNPTYDLRSLTVMPGMIDTHVHINGHFGKDGRADSRPHPLPPNR